MWVGTWTSQAVRAVCRRTRLGSGSHLTGRIKGRGGFVAPCRTVRSVTSLWRSMNGRIQRPCGDLVTAVAGEAPVRIGSISDTAVCAAASRSRGGSSRA
jgi:hypothetical protein